MILEGIEYRPYRVSFVLANGKRRRWVRWAPAPQYAAEAVARELDQLDVKPGSDVVIRELPR